MQCNCFTTYFVRLDGLCAKTHEPHVHASGTVGASVVFKFGDDWKEVPFRTASFRAGDMRIYDVPITDNTAIIPAEIMARPGVWLYVGVCGKDCEPDAESIARAAEIKERKSQILTETDGADSETVKVLMDEYMALHYELDNLNLVKKCYPSTFCRLGFIFPGTALP